MAFDFLGALFGNGNEEPDFSPINPSVNSEPVPEFNVSDAARALLGGNMPQQQQATPPERKGLFGVKGTFRDILGTLGDALLVSNGMKSIYAPGREQEKLGDAMSGFTNDPLGAINRLAEQGYANEAGALYKQYQANSMDERKLQSISQLRQLQAEAARDKGFKTIGSLAGTLNNPEAWERGLPMLMNVADRYGIDLGEIPTTYDEAWIAGLNRGGMSSREQASTDTANRRADDTKTHQQETIRVRERAQNISSADRAASRAASASNNQARISAADRRAQARIDAQDRRDANKGKGGTSKYPTSKSLPAGGGWGKASVVK